MIPCPKHTDVVPMRIFLEEPPKEQEVEVGLHCNQCKAHFTYAIPHIQLRQHMREYPQRRKQDEPKTT